MTPESFAQTRQFVDTSFGRIAVYTRGEGPPALFVHGFPLTAYFWRHQMEALADLRRCVAVDLLGLGYTEPVPGTAITYANQARMLAEVASAMELGPVDLVGNDSGGTIAQILATANPSQIRTLTLTNCEVNDNMPPPALVPLVEMARAALLGQAFEGMIADPAGMRAGFASAFARPEEALSDERIAYEFAPIVATEQRKAWASEYLCDLDPDITLGLVPALEKFDRPTLVIWADADEYMPLSGAHWLAETVPGVAKLVVVPGAKLFFPEEEPELVNRELRAFWR